MKGAATPRVTGSRPPDPSRTEKEIQRAIKMALRMIGFQVWDTSQPFKAKITPGLPDLFVTGRGITAWIECKSAKGKQSDAQRVFQDAVETNGGLYLIGRDEIEAVSWILHQADRVRNVSGTKGAGDVTREQYKRIRKRIGSRIEVAAKLGVHERHLAAREQGRRPLNTEAEMALRWLAYKAKQAKK